MKAKTEMKYLALSFNKNNEIAHSEVFNANFEEIEEIRERWEKYYPNERFVWHVSFQHSLLLR